jgi:hypothetical protein
MSGSRIASLVVFVANIIAAYLAGRSLDVRFPDASVGGVPLASRAWGLLLPCIFGLTIVWLGGIVLPRDRRFFIWPRRAPMDYVTTVAGWAFLTAPLVLNTLIAIGIVYR